MRGRKHLDRGVCMQIILLGYYLEILDALDYRRRALDYVYLVFDSVISGVAYPLTARHKLPGRRLSERVAHTAVTARKSDTALDRAADISLLQSTKLAHRDAGNYQIVREKRVAVIKAVNSRIILQFLRRSEQKGMQTLAVLYLLPYNILVFL